MDNLVVLIVVVGFVGWGGVHLLSDVWKNRRSQVQTNQDAGSHDAGGFLGNSDLGDPTIHLPTDLATCSPDSFDVGHCVEAIAHTISHH